MRHSFFDTVLTPEQIPAIGTRVMLPWWKCSATVTAADSDTVTLKRGARVATIYAAEWLEIVEHPEAQVIEVTARP